MIKVNKDKIIKPALQKQVLEEPEVSKKPTQRIESTFQIPISLPEKKSEQKSEPKISVSKKSTVVNKLSFEPPLLKQSNILDKLNERSIFHNSVRNSNLSKPDPKLLESKSLSRSKSPNQQVNVSKNLQTGKAVPGLPPQLMREKTNSFSKSPLKAQKTAPITSSRSPVKINEAELKKISQIKGPGFVFKDDFISDSFNTFNLDYDKKSKPSTALLNAPIRKGNELVSKKLIDSSKPKPTTQQSNNKLVRPPSSRSPFKQTF